MKNKKNAALLAAATPALVLVATYIPPSVFAQGEGEKRLQASLSIERHLQSQWPLLFPAAGDYVRYDITVKNTGQSGIGGRSLWVNFVPVQDGDDNNNSSGGGRQEIGSSAKFEVPLLAPGASTQLHVGPFKLHGDGNHALYLGIDKDGDAKSPDDVALNTQPGVPVDSVFAFDPAAAAALPAGIVIAAAGAALLGWLFLFSYPRKKRH